jgi:NADPH-dependent curcumin reductase
VLVRIIYLSLDPYMRGRMRNVASYAAPVGIGEVMPGGTVGEVVASQHPNFKQGDERKSASFVCEALGFDACVDYKRGGNLVAAIKEACPSGIDVYFDNVGGVVSDAVIPNLKTWARIALCGAISQYNAAAPEMGPRLPGFFVGRRVTMRCFIVSDFAAKYEPARRHIADMVRFGSLKYREDIVEGLENAPRAFIGLLRGENFGKLQVKLGPDPTTR